MIDVKAIRTLDVSAASGLLFIEGIFYVVADDELELLTFSKDPGRQPEKLKLLAGELPADHALRKKKKPDFESLVHLPSIDSVLVLPSGSEDNRRWGALVTGSKVEKIDFHELYQDLRKRFGELNIEGAVVQSEHLLLFSRGNGSQGQSLVIRLELKASIQELVTFHKIGADTFKNVLSVDLGSIEGFALGFTDAATEDSEKIWYLAVAESVKSTYEDGIFLGAVLGCMDDGGKILFQERLEISAKPEGFALDLENQIFYTVTDADDPLRRAQLFQGLLPQF